MLTDSVDVSPDLAGWDVAATKSDLTQQSWVLWHKATANGPPSWTFSNALTPASFAVAVTDYHNVDSTAPIGASAVTNDAPATTQPLPQVTTSSDANQIIHAVAYDSDVSAAAPTGDTTRAAVAGSASVLLSDTYQAQQGQTPAANATSNTAALSTAFTLALQPAPAAVARLGYAGHTDTTTFTQDTTGTTTGLMLALPGQATYTWTSTGNPVWSYANLHGDTITTANATGNPTWNGYWGPYGEPASGAQPANTPLNGDNLGYNGAQGKLTDNGTTQMGARSYQAQTGRFLTVDPIPGGCANNYTYTFGDPINSPDLTGQGFCFAGHNPNGSCRGSREVKKVAHYVKNKAGCYGRKILNSLNPIPSTSSGNSSAYVTGGLTAMGFGQGVLKLLGPEAIEEASLDAAPEIVGLSFLVGGAILVGFGIGSAVAHC